MDKRILNFTDWEINESWFNMQSLHFPERLNQRALGADEINLPDDLKKYFDPEQYRKIKKDCLTAFKDEILRRKSDLLKKDFPDDSLSAYPFISLFVKFKGKESPSEITSIYFDPKKQRSMESRGNQIFIPVVKNELKTLLVYPAKMDSSEIEQKIIQHSIRAYGDTLPFKGISPNSNFKYILEIGDDGTVGEIKKATVNADYYIKDQQYGLKKGRMLKVASKLSENGYLEGDVEAVLNKKTDKGKTSVLDKFLVLFLNTPKGKIRKQLNPDDVIYLPIADDGSYVKCKLISPGYIIDQRMDEPVNIKFRAVK